MTTVNINIKNCGCLGSGSSSGSDSGAGNDVFETEPTSEITPPKGYSSSAITGRNCKAAIWIYMWVESWLTIFSDNTWLSSSLLSQIAVSGGSLLLAKPIGRLLGGFVGAVFGLIATPGPTFDDLGWAAIGSVLAGGLIQSSINYGADKLTQLMIEEALPAFQALRDDFICQIAKGKNASESASNLQSWLIPNFPEPIQWIIYNFSTIFLNMVFFTAEWWPDSDDHLTGITEVCCEGYQDGTLIEPGSAKACTSANFVLDGLVGVLTAADMYVQNYSRTGFNSLSSTEAAMLSNVQANYLVPASITGKAWSWQLSQAELARYMYGKLSGSSWLTPTSGGGSYWELGNLGADLQVNIPICDLRNAETPQAAYELLAAQIDAWLAANVTDTTLANHIRLFVQGLIHPDGAFIGVLFTESADLAGFAGSSDCAECDPDFVYQINYGTVINSGTNFVDVAPVSHPTNGAGIRYVSGQWYPLTAVTVTFTILSGTVYQSNDYEFVIYSATEMLGHQDSPYVNYPNVAGYEIGSYNEYTIRVSWSVT